MSSQTEKQTFSPFPEGRGIFSGLFQPRPEYDAFELSAPKKHYDWLGLIESEYGIDLSASKTIPAEDVRGVYRLVKTYNDWLDHTYRKSYHGSFLLLTEEDHETLVPMKGTREEAYGPGGRYRVMEIKGRNEQFIIITVFDAHSLNPNASTPVEAVVAEEMLHGISSMDSLEYTYRSITHNDVWWAEEIAVKHYVNRMLRENGLKKEAKAFARIGGMQDLISMWELFIKRVGENRADHMFLHGYGGSDRVREDWDVYQEVAKEFTKKREAEIDRENERLIRDLFRGK